MKPIVAPVDFSDATPRVVAEAVALAQPLQAPLVFLHVTQPSPPVASEFAFIGIDPSVEVVAEQSALQRLAYLQQQLATQGITASTMHAAGNPGAIIVARARELNASYIILGSHGHGVIYDLLVGSTAKRVVKDAHCPVIVIPTRARSHHSPGPLAFEPIDATEEPPPSTTSRVLTPAHPTNRSATCDECGAFGALAVGDRWLCERCYSEKGSCCPEFGKDDLWADRIDHPTNK